MGGSSPICIDVAQQLVFHFTVYYTKKIVVTGVEVRWCCLNGDTVEYHVSEHAQYT